jgi:hypothetical membrane protein
MNSNNRNLLRLSSSAGIVIPIFFTAMVAIESVLRPGYSQISDEISFLGVGPYSYLQNANFIISGLLAIVFALGFSVSLSSGSRRLASRVRLALVIFAMAIILAGVTLLLSENIVPAIPAYYAHTVASFVAFLAIITGQFLTWQAAKIGGRILWKRYGLFSLLSGILSTIFLLVFLLTSIGPYEGLTERLFVSIVLVWIEVTGIKLHSTARSGNNRNPFASFQRDLEKGF